MSRPKRIEPEGPDDVPVNINVSLYLSERRDIAAWAKRLNTTPGGAMRDLAVKEARRKPENALSIGVVRVDTPRPASSADMPRLVFDLLKDPFFTNTSYGAAYSVFTRGPISVTLGEQLPDGTFIAIRLPDHTMSLVTTVDAVLNLFKEKQP